jgi:hypothetical protein
MLSGQLYAPAAFLLQKPFPVFIAWKADLFATIFLDELNVRNISYPYQKSNHISIPVA